MSDHPFQRRPAPAKRTAKAVAERAGVSVTTVSRVLNGQVEAISESTCERVVAAARELGYRPNSLAVALRKGMTRTVGLLVPDISDAYFHQVARGVEDVAREADHMVVFCNTDRVAAKELACVELLDDQRVDALIFAGGGVDDEKHLVDYRWDRLQVVTIGPHLLPFPSIRVDDTAAIATAVRHLAGEGCRRVLCVAGEPNWLITQARLAGYQEAVRTTGIDADPDLVMHARFSQHGGCEAVREALARGTAFDGVVAFNDYQAIGAMDALRDTGVTVPDEVAVIGCDDIAEARLVHPALSSIGFTQYEFGRAAMRMVLDMVAGKEVDRLVEFPHQLEVRASSRLLAHRSGRKTT